MIDFINKTANVWANYFILFTIQNAIFLIGILGLLYVFRKKSALLLYSISLIGLIKLLIPPIFPSPFSVNAEWLSMLYRKFGALHIFQFSGTLSQSEIVSPISGEGISLTSGQFAKADISLTVASWLFLFWIIIGLGIIVFYGWRYYQLNRMICNTTPLDNPEISQKSSRKIRIFHSRHNHSPFVFGLLNYKIILPKCWDSWSDECQRSVLSHELKHIRFYDNWINVLMLIAQAIHFINPFVWILSRKIIYIREMVCDDAVINDEKMSTINYSKHLMTIAESISNSTKMNFLTAFTKPPTSLGKRVMYQLSKQKGEKTMTRGKVIMLTALLAVLIIPFSWYYSEGTAESSRKDTIPAETNMDIDPGAVLNKNEGMNFTVFDALPLPKYESGSGGQVTGISVSVPPRPFHEIIPDYAESEMRKGYSGIIELKIRVDEKGNVTDVEVLNNATKSKILEELSTKAALLSKYFPARDVNNKPIAVWTLKTFSFNSNSSQVTIANRPSSLEEQQQKKVETKMEEIPSFLPEQNQTKNFLNELLKNVDYPDRAKLAGKQVTVIIEASTDVNGNILYFQVAQSSGVSSLDNAVLEVIKKAKITTPKPGSSGILTFKIPLNFAELIKEEQIPAFLPADSIPKYNREELIKNIKSNKTADSAIPKQQIKTVPVPTFYIDTQNGSDETGNGSKEKPYKTILYVIQKEYLFNMYIIIKQGDTKGMFIIQLSEKTAAPPAPPLPAIIYPILPQPAVKDTQKTQTQQQKIKEEVIPAFLPEEDWPKFNRSELIKNIVYPQKAREANIEGTVVVRVLIDKDGTPVEFVVLQSLGWKSGDEAVFEGIEKTSFKPATSRGIPVPYRIVIKVTFEKGIIK